MLSEERLWKQASRAHFTSWIGPGHAHGRSKRSKQKAGASKNDLGNGWKQVGALLLPYLVAIKNRSGVVALEAGPSAGAQELGLPLPAARQHWNRIWDSIWNLIELDGVSDLRLPRVGQVRKAANY